MNSSIDIRTRNAVIALALSCICIIAMPFLTSSKSHLGLSRSLATYTDASYSNSVERIYLVQQDLYAVAVPARTGDTNEIVICQVDHDSTLPEQQEKNEIYQWTDRGVWSSCPMRQTAVCDVALGQPCYVLITKTNIPQSPFEKPISYVAEIHTHSLAEIQDIPKALAKLRERD